MPLDRPAEPWFSFLTALDAQLSEAADFHCIGGFVVSRHYGLGRETADLDVLTVVPRDVERLVIQLAGKGSALQREHRVSIDHVRAANYPANYEGRLIRAFPVWSKVRLWALEPHDLALTKLERSNERDIRDVIFLAQAGLINHDTLVSRFETELERTSRAGLRLGTRQRLKCGSTRVGRDDPAHGVGSCGTLASRRQRPGCREITECRASTALFGKSVRKCAPRLSSRANAHCAIKYATCHMLRTS
jgi:Nucleotidyltransferase of unknown function (DUF6036)